MNNNKNDELNITCKIWEKEVFQLVDYYNPQFTKTKLQINSSGVLYREENKVHFIQDESQEKTNDKLLSIKKNESSGEYSVNCGTWSKDLANLIDENAAFIVYRGISLKDNKNTFSHRYYKLNPGDIMKIGRIYFKVLDIHVTQKKDRLGLGFNIKGDESTFKGSNCNSIIINGQEVIKGIYNKKGENNKKFLEHYLSGVAKPQKNSFFNLEKSESNNKLSENLFKYNNNNEKDNPIPDLFALTKRPEKKQKSKKNIILSNMNTISQTNDAQNNKNNNNNNENIKSTKQCRICYGEDSTDENPLIYPCICKNTTKYIHYECLKKWLNSKIEEDMSMDSETTEIEVISYNRKDISCEICKENLPDYIKYKNRTYNISFYKPKYKEYIVLESMRADKHKAKFIHLISLDNKDSVHIGRANECELSIAELSVSRFHCILHKDDGEIYLEDNTSKFGTLVLVQNNNIIINNAMALNLQINKTFIKIKIPRVEGCSFLCYKDAPVVEQSLLNYQVQNNKGLEVLSNFIIKINDDNEKEEETDEKNNINNSIHNDANKNKELIDEENKEQTEENVVICSEQDLIDKNNDEDCENNNNNKSAFSENKANNSTKIKKMLIKKDLIENDDMNKNNLSSIVNKKNNFAVDGGSAQSKIINLIKIKNNQKSDIAYDKTKSNPVTTNNNQNVHKINLININKEECNKDE